MFTKFQITEIFEIKACAFNKIYYKNLNLIVKYTILIVKFKICVKKLMKFKQMRQIIVAINSINLPVPVKKIVIT